MYASSSCQLCRSARRTLRPAVSASLHSACRTLCSTLCSILQGSAQLQDLHGLQCALHAFPLMPCSQVLACTLQIRAQLQGVHRLPVWAAPEPPNAMHLPAFSAYPQLYVTAAGEHLMMLPQLLESLQAGPEEEQAEGDSEWLDKVSVGDCFSVMWIK